MENYLKQAEDFLNKHNIKFKAVFVEYGLYFIDDKESRDIFKIFFIRGKKRFSLTFGQSLNDSTGAGDNLPDSYDVLAGITKNKVGTFENFCFDFGYNIDSRNAEKIYKTIVKEWKKVSNFFTAKEIEELQEIQ